MDFILLLQFLSESMYLFYLNQKVKYTISCPQTNQSALSLQCILLIFIYKIRMATIYHCCISTVQWVFFSMLTPQCFSVSPLSNQELVLLLDNLDDVLVLHDVRQADPLRAVLGTGSLEDQQMTQFRPVLFACLGFKCSETLGLHSELVHPLCSASHVSWHCKHSCSSKGDFHLGSQLSEH